MHIRTVEESWAEWDQLHLPHTGCVRARLRIITRMLNKEHAGSEKKVNKCTNLKETNKLNQQGKE